MTRAPIASALIAVLALIQLVNDVRALTGNATLWMS